ncbi:MAG: UDP-N-acetylmuramoyl-L-alanyl-D-glutamate--2,6-diaminopimelate ligase [Halanaerobiales bacterium]|nr:UDP-N-acetylmuramoyl-L-alanyl-D-glutamate--2,6-diaminopimelate ligase [Halanaerobiales bacterium]
MKNLEIILQNLGEYQLHKAPTVKEITGITYDSRQVKPGFIFVSIRGFQLDGHDYIDQAIKNGAQVIVIEKDVPYNLNITYIKVENSREALGKLSEAFYDFSWRKLNLIGVTGTNGKTTTTYMIESILRGVQLKTGVIGTIQNKIDDEIVSTQRTTPESSDLHQLFNRMVLNCVNHTVMEVSSHALELKRVMDLSFKVGVFTNISQDHLDFHDTLENYKIAKGKLFKNLSIDGVGVVNLDDLAGDYMIEQCTGKVLTYGIHREADIKALEIEINVNGVSYLLETPIGKIRMNLKFTGYFNVYNSLAAIGVGLALQIPLEVIKEGLESLSGVAGRFEQVDAGQKFGVIVDFAHSPDGMENVLKTVQEFENGRKIVVFGCGGDRDRTKRPIMGKIAAKYSDLIIVTSDNSRTEDPLQILKDVEEGFKEFEGPVEYHLIAERRVAIFHAVREAEPGDLVIILGKGHETYQICNGYTIPFDDREVVKEAILANL